MKALYWGLFSLSFSAFSLAENLTVYRWVDKNNVVHFSQHQPSHNNYTEMSLANVSKPKNYKSLPTKETEPETPATASVTDDKCEEAKTNLKTLKAYDNIQYTDANGKAQVLDEKAKALQLLFNEKQLEIYCEN